MKKKKNKPNHFIYSSSSLTLSVSWMSWVSNTGSGSSTLGVLWAVPQGNSISQRSFKMSFFCMKILLYIHMFLIHEKDKYMLIDSYFSYQQLFSVSYSYLTKDKYFLPGEWLSIGTGCWDRLLTLHPWRYLKLNWAWHSADEKLKLGCCE